MKLDLTKMLDDAAQSPWGMRKLNFALSMGIPFNRPHGIKVHKVEPHAVVSVIPYKRKNMNHIRGTHACGLATAAEFCSGLVLLRRLGAKTYRLIMQRMEVTYTFQAKEDCFARFELTDEVFQRDLLGPLERDGVVTYVCEIPVHDASGNLVCTAHTNWHMKRWADVRTK